MKDRDHIIIAIDGPAGAGKSTVAKEVSRSLSFLYIDSGAMYRAVAWKTIDRNVDLGDKVAISKIAENMELVLRPADGGVRVFVDGEEVTQEIRAPEVTDVSSRVATIPAVRIALVERQREMGRSSDVVMEGRDIGTVVFPDTPFKFYLDASARERAQRRKKDLDLAGYPVDIEQLEQEVVDRDNRDKTRSMSPLQKVEDATVIDSTAMTIDQVVDTIINHVNNLRERIKEQ